MELQADLKKNWTKNRAIISTYGKKTELFDNTTYFHILQDVILMIHFLVTKQKKDQQNNERAQPLTKRIYNPITAMGFLAMFTFHLCTTKR